MILAVRTSFDGMRMVYWKLSSSSTPYSPGMANAASPRKYFGMPRFRYRSMTAHKPKVFYESFSYQAQSWDRPRRVVAKVEWHWDQLFPRVGFIVTNMTGWSKKVVKFYNGRGTAEQWIKEGKYAVKWTRLSCRNFRDNQTRLQLFALAYNLGNFLRRLALPRSVKHWSLTTLREKLIKIGAKVVRHSGYVIFQMAEVAVPRDLFAAILERIQRFGVPPPLVQRG